MAASPGTGAAAADFTLSTNKTLTIGAGGTTSTGTVTITAVDNDVDAPNKTVTVSATASGGNGVANPANQTLTITDDEGAPETTVTITGVAITSTPLIDTDGDSVTDTYGLGEKIRVRLTFSEAVAVDTNDGKPRLKIDMDPADWGEKWAGYESGTGTVMLTFVHTVVPPNISTQGVAVLANSLALNGGTIRSVATQTDATLAHAGLGHDANHKVDYNNQIGEQQSPPPSNRAPAAYAGGNLTVDPGTRVSLDGSGSFDPDGDNLSYAWSQTKGETVILSGAGTPRPSFTAPWMPGPLSFRLTVTDPEGLSGYDRVTVTVNDLAPDFGDATVAALIMELGQTMEPITLPTATGGNGALSYSLVSQPAGLAGLSFDPATRRLSGPSATEGNYSFIYRAHDADDNRSDSDAAVLRIAVTVKSLKPNRQEMLRHILAAVGSQELGSALDHIGTRFADAPPISLTLAGQNVPLGKSGTSGNSLTDGHIGHDGLERNIACLSEGFGGGLEDDSGGLGFGPNTCRDPFGEPYSRGMTPNEMLASSSFSITLGADEETDGIGSGGVTLGFWGWGGLGSFEGRPDPDSHYSGETRSGWLGVDARAGKWVAGLALSRGTSESDYRFTDTGTGLSGQARLETSLTSLWPYGRWTLDGDLEFRGMLGAGRGEARHAPEGLDREVSDLSMQAVSVGLHRALPSAAGLDLAVRGDVSLMRLLTGDGNGIINSLEADTRRLRVGVEASRRFAVGENSELTPFAETVVRRDGGDGLTGTGWEVAGGVRYAAKRFQVEARGRWLASHTASGTRERGVSITARVEPKPGGRGLSLSLTPRWGAQANVTDALWSENMPHLADSAGADIGTLEGHIGYGFALSSPNGLLTPFAEAGMAGGDGSRRFQFGTRFETARTDLYSMVVELSGERRESATADPEHALRLDLRIRF